jgi:hypothetical protein
MGARQIRRQWYLPRRYLIYPEIHLLTYNRRWASRLSTRTGCGGPQSVCNIIVQGNDRNGDADYADSDSRGTKIRVDNIHYDLTEEELHVGNQ